MRPQFVPGMLLSMEFPDGAKAMGTIAIAPAGNLAIRTPHGLFGFAFRDELAPMFADANITVVSDPRPRTVDIDQPI